MDYGSGIHPHQRNVHPLATGVSFERFFILNASKQNKAYLKEPAYQDAWAKQKWPDLPVATARDNYGWRSV